jgi:DNA-binding response OmpR family regulator
LFGGEKQTIQRMLPMLQRVLICDPSPQSAKFLNELMRDISRAQVWLAPTNERGMRQAGICEPQLIFVEYQADGVNGLAFTRELRRSTLPCRQAPVIMVTSEATAAAILGARDSGVHEFLRKPFSLKDLLRRLEAVTLRSRDWVEGVGYVGPDRRRFNSGDYSGPLKRGADDSESPDQGKLQQALKILRVATAAIEKDPQQASRAILAQAQTIAKVGQATADTKLHAAASNLHRHVQWSQGGDPLTVAQITPYVTPLMEYLKEEPASQKAA